MNSALFAGMACRIQAQKKSHEDTPSAKGSEYDWKRVWPLASFNHIGSAFCGCLRSGVCVVACQPPSVIHTRLDLDSTQVLASGTLMCGIKVITDLKEHVLEGA